MADSKPSGQFPVPGFALIVIALGVLVFTDNPFNPTRPAPPPELTSTAEDVLARLWQDPFEAVEKHRDSKHSEKIIIHGNQTPEVARNNSKVAAYTMYQDQHHRICSLTKPGLEDSFYPPIATSAHTIEELRCQIQRDVEINSNKTSDLHILAVMVSGNPYAENRETRIRSRYAVISGLSNAGYIPKDAEHIGYMDFSEQCKKGLASKLKDDVKYCDWPATIPYEWFTPKETQDTEHENNQFAKNILVLWLNDGEIARNKPLRMLERLSNALKPGFHERFVKLKSNQNKRLVRIKFDVIGPTGSTTLIKMYQEATLIDNRTCKKDYPNFCHQLNIRSNNANVDINAEKLIRIISPRATIDEKAIHKSLNIAEDKNLKDWLTIYRTIPEDKELVSNLLCSLLQRGVNPYWHHSDIFSINKKKDIWAASSCQNYSLRHLNKNKKQDHIVLIGEWDTVYSRNFNRLFREQIKNKSMVEDITWLHSYNYFRGIDGSVASSKDESLAKNDNNTDKNKKSFRRPVGENQFDYLRRLGDQLSTLSKSIINTGSIRAIGIVGSDTYDKLLILQALRSRFPSVIFFTTDLDARMLHTDENEWARNLIVASGYGLHPDDHFQGLPFRDSYQTSLYFATHDSTQKNAINTNVSNSVKIFEVGNSNAVDYSYQSQTPKLFTSNNCKLYIILSLILLFLLIYQTSNSTRKYIILSAILIYSVIIWIAILNPFESTEFNAMLTGTSIWPANIVRMLAAILAVYFILLVIIKLKLNSIEIIIKHKLSDLKYKGLVDTLRECLGVESERTKIGINTLLPCIKQTTVAALTFFNIQLFNGDEAKSNNLVKPRLVSKLFLTSWGWLHQSTTSIKIENLFYQYMYIAKTRWWLARVSLMTGLYFGISYHFIYSFQTLPFTSFSDENSAFSHEFILFSMLLPYTFLIFLVVDVTRLNARFIELLTKCRIEWTETLLSGFRNDYGVSDEVAVEKLKLDLIILRAKTVDVFIFLPFIILSLTIISRSNYFDRWHMPIQLSVVILLGAIIALSSAIRFRRTAKRARQCILENLYKLYSTCHKDECKNNIKIQNANIDFCDNKMSERILAIIDDIKQIDKGPFAPIARHPIVTAIAMPFGGVGGLYLIDYLSGLGV